MQIDGRDYNAARHDRYRALSVKQPYADLLTYAIYRDSSGIYHAEKAIEVRSRNTAYRGDLMVCSSASPRINGRLSGVTCGFVELYGVKAVEEFTAEDWAATCIPEDERPRKGWGWLMRNPRRVVEMPIRGQLGVYYLVVPKGDITEYPRAMALGDDGWQTIQKAL